jgi:hypothetical protein
MYPEEEDAEDDENEVIIQPLFNGSDSGGYQYKCDDTE